MFKPYHAAVAAASTAVLAIALMGSDHKDGPNATADHAADIADLYAWHDTAAGKFTAVVTFAGLAATGVPATYDPNVIYTIHIDRAAAGAAFDNVPDVDISLRFAKNARGEWGYQVSNLPGASAALSGLVSTEINDGAKRKVYAGLRDDPFFFDLDGFKASLAKPASNSTLSFSNTHDSFAGTNITALVVEMDLADVTVNGTQPKLALWASSRRKPSAIGFKATTSAATPILAQR